MTYAVYLIDHPHSGTERDHHSAQNCAYAVRQHLTERGALRIYRKLARWCYPDRNSWQGHAWIVDEATGLIMGPNKERELLMTMPRRDRPSWVSAMPLLINVS